MAIDRTVKIGDLLTTVTIIISVIVLYSSWRSDRDLQQRELANDVRMAVAQTLTKLERWQGLHISLFSDLQVAVVETSQMLARSHQVAGARDFLWKELNRIHADIDGRIMEEGIETAYVELNAFQPTFRGMFRKTIDSLTAYESAAFAQLLGEMEQDVLNARSEIGPNQSAELGNALRATAERHLAIQTDRIDHILEPPRKILISMVQKGDAEILKRAAVAD